MAVTVVPTKIQVFPVEGYIDVMFSDSVGMTFRSLQELRDHIQPIDRDRDLAKRIALGWILARQPSLTNVSAIVNKQLIFDLANATPIRIV
jgi:hypothetical protein